MSRLVSIAVVTGAGSGIGRAIALELSEQGHEIIILEVEEPAGEESAILIAKTGGTARVISCDVSQTESVRDAFTQFETCLLYTSHAADDS